MLKYEFPGRLNRVVDGDSVRLDLDLGFRVHMNDVRFRLFGIDTPEIFSGSILERSAGQRARAFVLEWFERADSGEEYPLRVRTLKTSKYGDVLARVWDGLGDELGLRLLDEGFGRVYLGNKKSPWSDQILREMLSNPRLNP